MAVGDIHTGLNSVTSSGTWSVAPPSGEAWTILSYMSENITTVGSNYDDMPDLVVYLHDGVQGVVVRYNESRYHWKQKIRLQTTPDFYMAQLNTATGSGYHGYSAIEADPNDIFQGDRQSIATSSAYSWTPPVGDEWWITDYGFNERVGSLTNQGFDCRLMHDNGGYSWIRQGDGRNLVQAMDLQVGCDNALGIRIYNLGTNTRVCTVNGLLTKT